MGQAGVIRLGRVAAGLAIGAVSLLGAIGLGAGAVSAGTTPAAANSLATIEPADAAALAAAPTRLVLGFNQELGRNDFATVDLTCAGKSIDTGIGEKDDESLFVTFQILDPVPGGICIIDWELSDELGATITAAQSTFRVDISTTATTPAAGGNAATPSSTVPGDLIQVPATTAVPDAASEPEASPGGALWFGRFVSVLGILVVFGALALISVGWPEGPEYIVTVRFLRTMWAVALAGTVIYVITLTADVTGRSFSSSVSPTAWLDLLDAGWAGRGAILRLIAVGASGAVALRPERIIDPTSAMWAWAIPGVAVISTALGRVDGSLAPIGFLVGALHALGAAVWIGGLVLVARVVLAGPGDDDLIQATRTFSRISVPAIALTCLTGVVQMVRLDGGQLFSSGHGRVVLLKAITVAVMIAMALAARQQVGMRLARVQELTAPVADRFRRAFGAEATVGVVVLAFSGWLLALTPPTSDPLANQSYLVGPIAFEVDSAQFSGSLSIGTNQVGRTGFKLDIDAPEAGLSNVKLRFKPPVGTTGDGRFWIDQTIDLTGAGTAWLANGSGIPLAVAGTWNVEISAITPTGAVAKTFQFVVVDGDGQAPPAATSQVTTAPNVSFQIVDPTPPPADFATTTTTVASLFGSTP